MSQDISAFGLNIYLIASNTFPVGIPLTQFADDADPFDLPSMTIGDNAMGINGDLVSWSKANPIKTTLSVIAGSDDDLNLQVLFENNRPGRGKTGTRDVITLTGIYPDGSKVSLLNGNMTDGMPGNSVASSGRLKSKTYGFSFENKVSS